MMIVIFDYLEDVYNQSRVKMDSSGDGRMHHEGVSGRESHTARLVLCEGMDLVDEDDGGHDAILSNSEQMQLQGRRCAVCYTFMEGAEAWSLTEMPVVETGVEEGAEDEDGSDQRATTTTVSLLYRVLRVRNINCKDKEDMKLPLCPLCEESIQEAWRIMCQIEELDKSLKSLGNDMKEKLLSSFEESRMDDWGSLCELMEGVARIRSDIAKGTG
jgi:hypothetical protein